MKLRNRFLPLWGVIVDDIKHGLRHWAIVWWAVLSLLLAIVWFIETPITPASEQTDTSFATASSFDNATQDFGQANEVRGPRASVLAGKTIRLHLFLWATLVIAFAGSSIASESDIVAESILCRGISRWMYYAGKVIARTAVSVAGFLALTIPVILLSLTKCHNDLSFDGTIAALLKGSLLLGLVAAVSVAGSSWFKSPLLAVAVAWMAVYGAAIVVSLLQIETLSPLRFIETVIALPRRPDAVLTATSLISYLGIATLVVNIVSLVSFSRRDY